MPTIVTAVSAAQPDVMLGQRKNVPRRRSGTSKPEGSSFLSNPRRKISETLQKSSFNSGTPNPVKKFHSKSGTKIFFSTGAKL